MNTARHLDDFYMTGQNLTIAEEFALRMALSGKSMITINDLMHFGTLLRIDDMRHKVSHALVLFHQSDANELSRLIGRHRSIFEQNPTYQFEDIVRHIYKEECHNPKTKEILDNLLQFSDLDIWIACV